MKSLVRASLLGALLAAAPAILLADDLEGVIEMVNAAEQSFVVQGITFYTTDATDYDDGLAGFGDLSVGLKVEVDFKYVGHRHIATEIEVED